MSREPTGPLLKSFLVTFRHFVSDKEPVFVNSVANTLWQDLYRSAGTRRGRLN